MNEENLQTRIRALEKDNVALRRIHDDQRNHLAALREEVQTLRNEVSQLMLNQESLEAENRLLRKENGGE
jgi:hypothetical protein